MRVARFGDNLVGVVRDDGIHDVTTVLSELPPYGGAPIARAQNRKRQTAQPRTTTRWSSPW